MTSYSARNRFSFEENKSGKDNSFVEERPTEDFSEEDAYTIERLRGIEVSVAIIICEVFSQFRTRRFQKTDKQAEAVESLGECDEKFCIARRKMHLWCKSDYSSFGVACH